MGGLSVCVVDLFNSRGLTVELPREWSQLGFLAFVWVVLWSFLALFGRFVNVGRVVVLRTCRMWVRAFGALMSVYGVVMLCMIWVSRRM